MKKAAIKFLIPTILITLHLQGFSIKSNGNISVRKNSYARIQDLENNSQDSITLTNKTFTTIYIAKEESTNLTEIKAKTNFSFHPSGKYIIYPHNRAYGNALCLEYDESKQVKIYYCTVKNGIATLKNNQTEYVSSGNLSIYTDSTQPHVFLTIR